MQDLTLKKKHVIPLGSIEIGPDAAGFWHDQKFWFPSST